MTTPTTSETSASSASPFPATTVGYGSDWTVSEALGKGLEGLREHWKVLIPAALLVNFLSEGIRMVLEEAGAQLGGAAELTLGVAGGGSSLLLAMVLSAGFLRITLDTARGETPQLRSFMTSAGSALPLLACYLLTGALVALGSLAFIVPGLMVAVGLSFAPLLIIDRKRGAIESMHESWALLDGHKLPLFRFSLILGLVALLLATPAVLLASTGTWLSGLLLCVPLVAIAAIAGVGQAWIYLRLRGVQPR